MINKHFTFNWLLADLFEGRDTVPCYIEDFAFRAMDEYLPPLRELRTLNILLHDWNDLISWEIPELSELSLQLQDLSQVEPNGGAEALAFFKTQVPFHQFRKLRKVEYFSYSATVFMRDALVDSFITFLEMTPSLVTILLPNGGFLSGPDEAPIDQLARKLLDEPFFCPYLQEISSHEYPNDWITFFRMITGRCLRSLLSFTGLPKSMHTVRFHLLPRPQVVQQLEDSMGGRQLTPQYTIPPCIYSTGIEDLKAQAHPENKVCFICHTGRLEQRCERSNSYCCLR